MYDYDDGDPGRHEPPELEECPECGEEMQLNSKRTE